MGLDSPASFNIQVIPPAPDPTVTTRQRYDVHVKDAICAGCHDVIDPFGFSFEHYDGMGATARSIMARTSTAPSTSPFGETSTVTTPTATSSPRRSPESPNVRECFARFMFRAAAGTGDGAATSGEEEFVAAWRATPAAARGDIVETLVRDVKSPSFALRGAP